MDSHRREILDAASDGDETAQMQAEPDPLKREMIRDHAPHPLDLCGNLAHDYEHVDEGKWKIEASDGGWYEDVMNGLWMEGYLVRGTEVSERGNVVHTIIEEKRLSTSVCPACGERNEPDFSGDSTTCPDCGADH